MIRVEPTMVGVSAVFASAGDEVEGAAHFVMRRRWYWLGRTRRSRGCCESLKSPVAFGMQKRSSKRMTEGSSSRGRSEYGE